MSLDNKRIVVTGSAAALPARFNGIPGIDQQIDEHLFEAAGIGRNLGQVLADIPDHLDPRSFQSLK